MLVFPLLTPQRQTTIRFSNGSPSIDSVNLEIVQTVIKNAPLMKRRRRALASGAITGRSAADTCVKVRPTCVNGRRASTDDGHLTNEPAKQPCMIHVSDSQRSGRGVGSITVHSEPLKLLCWTRSEYRTLHNPLQYRYFFVQLAVGSIGLVWRGFDAMSHFCHIHVA